MTVTRDSYALAELKYCLLPTSVNNVQSLVVWMASENTNAEWNPQATERGEPDTTDYNPDGVKNYPSIEEGLQAFRNTLYNGAYMAIIECLTRSAVPAETCATIVNSPWGSKPTPELVGEVLTSFDEYANVAVGGSTVSVEPPPVIPPVKVPSVPIEEEDTVQLPTLQDGSTGQPVKAVQLIVAGANRITIDGVYGSITEGYVKFYQGLAGLTVDGIVGPLTWNKMLVD